MEKKAATVFDAEVRAVVTQHDNGEKYGTILIKLPGELIPTAYLLPSKNEVNDLALDLMDCAKNLGD